MKAVAIVLFVGMSGAAVGQSPSTAEAAKFKETVVWSFGNGTDGRYPYAGLIGVNNTFYGTTGGGGNSGCYGGCGTVFSLDPGTGAEKVLYSFCSQANCGDGEYPEAGLIK